MPRYTPNKMPTVVKRRYFELIRAGLSGSAAADEVVVSLSCGSLWFIDTGQVSFIEIPISPRYLSQDDRIEIADGMARGEPVKQIAARIGKSHQSVYREIARNRKPDGRYQPWHAHNQAHLRRRLACGLTQAGLLRVWEPPDYALRAGCLGQVGEGVLFGGGD